MTTKHLILMAMLLSVTILLGYLPSIPLPILPVPIVMQNLAIMLLGGLLGWRKGVIVTAVFLIMAALGLPVLSGGRGGISLFFTASGGYLLAYPIAVFFIGYSLEKISIQFTFSQALVTMILFGVILINLIGILFITVYLDAPFKSLLVSLLAFIPGDMIKAVIAAMLIYRLKYMSLLYKNSR